MPDEQPTYQIIIDRDAQRSLRRLPKPLESRIRTAIRNLAIDPRPPGCLKLTSHHHLWRIRVGDWRIIYAIHDDQLVVVIAEIEPRARAYRNL